MIGSSVVPGLPNRWVMPSSLSSARNAERPGPQPPFGGPPRTSESAEANKPPPPHREPQKHVRTIGADGPAHLNGDAPAVALEQPGFWLGDAIENQTTVLLEIGRHHRP